MKKLKPPQLKEDNPEWQETLASSMKLKEVKSRGKKIV